MNLVLDYVIGLGSEHGSDRVGWEVVARLKELCISQLCLRATSDPLSILDVPPECKLLIVVDASTGGGSPGTVQRFVWPDSRLLETGGVSSHGLGLVSAVRLAETLGKIPSRVIVFAIEADSGEPGSKLDPAVEAAIPKVAAMILAETAPGITRDT
jgi:hydrogenase maturation protease